MASLITMAPLKFDLSEDLGGDHDLIFLAIHCHFCQDQPLSAHINAQQVCTAHLPARYRPFEALSIHAEHVRYALFQAILLKLADQTLELFRLYRVLQQPVAGY